MLLIDNYDSFTFNLYHYLEELYEGEITVMRNDEIDFSKINGAESIVISPGPGLPHQSGDLMKLLAASAESKKILGICLGQQAIAEHFGLQLKNLKEVVHGQARKLKVTDAEETLFKGLPNEFKVGRYHSWMVDKASNTKELLITSEDEDGNIMSLKHKYLPIKSLQFHPESVLTEYGKQMIANWLNHD